MNIDDLISRKFRVQVLESRVLSSATFSFAYPYSYAFLDVFRGITPLERTGTFKFGEKPLANVLFLLDVKYFDERTKVQYALYVFTPKKDTAVQTTVKIRRPMAGSDTDLKVMDPRQNVTDIVKTVQVTESRAYSDVFARPSKGPQTRRLRLNPEVRYLPWKTTNGTLGFPDIITSGVKQVYNRTYTSVNTPQFRKKAASGTLPINPHTVAIQSVDSGQISKDYGYTYHPGGVYVGKSRETTQSSLSNRVTVASIAASHNGVNKNQVIGRLKNQIGLGLSANIGEDIAQIGQTLRLFTGSVNTLRSGFLSAVKSSQLQTANRFNKSTSRAVKNYSQLAAETWLQYRYGWIPLLDTIDALKTVFFSKVAKDPSILTVKASAKRRTSSRDTFLISSSLGLPAYRGNINTFVDTKLTIGLRYGMDSSAVNTASQLGLTGPTNLAWNLIPLSFVIDWFYPIGQALESFSAFDGLSFKGGYETYFTRKRVTADIDASVKTESVDYSRYENYSEHVSGESILLSRSALTGFPTPQAPQVKNPASLIHAANAAALLIVAFTGRRR